MLDSDGNNFYIGEQQIKDQEEQRTEIGKNENLQNCALSQSKLNCKLVKIENRRGHPNFHFEIDGKSYFYGIERIRQNYIIVLRCTKTVNNCSRSTIMPSDFLKEIIQNSPTISKNSKILDKSDPRVYDLKNYDLNSFYIGGGHTCPGTEIKKVSKPEIFVNKPQFLSINYNCICKLVKIENHRGYPKFHFEINGKMYFYGMKRVRLDNKIVLLCTKTLCNNISTVLPSDFLKEIIQKKKLNIKNNYAKILDKSDPRVYNIDNYDINSFDIGKGHKCSGTEIKEILESNIKPEIDLKCKLVKIVKTRGFPHLHFEINGKMYVYGIVGVKADNKIVLRCNKRLSGPSLPCSNISTVLLSDCLKEIFQKKTSEIKHRYSKIFDKSDPRVYDIDNYDINSFDIGGGHNCSGTEIDVYFQTTNGELGKI
jgi:hypothetical protein